MIKIREIAFTGYPVTDIARARRFYEGVLGLVPSTTFGEGDKLWVEYDLGTGTLAINNISQGLWNPSPDGPALAFEVEDFDAAVATLRQAGAKFVLDPMAYPTCRLAVFLDPDGNSLAIHRRNLNAA